MTSWSYGSSIPTEDSGARRGQATLEGLPFRVLGVLGEGGMARVYRAVDTQNRTIALKVLKAGSDQRRVDRLLREGRLAASLDHPNVVPLMGLGIRRGQPYLSFGLVEGARTLDQAFAEQRGLDERIRLLSDVARGVAHAHEQGITHRDLKPANVLVDPHGTARVTDFGLGTADDVQRLTLTGALVGTPHWMSPEQIEAKRGAQGPHTDVWALGVMLYEALTDSLPFEGDDLMELAVAIVSGPVVSPRRLVASTPAGLERVCLRALAKAPAERYANAGEFLAALESAEEPPGPSRARALRLGAVLALLSGAFFAGLALQGAGREPAVTPGPASAPSSPEAPALDANPSASALAEAERLQQLGDFAGGLRVAEALLEEDPSNAEAWRVKGDMQGSLGSFSDAIPSFRRAISLRPTASALTGLGLSLHRSGESDAGLAALDAAIERDASYTPGWTKRSLVRYERGEHQPALEDAVHAIELDVDDAQAWNCKGMALMGLDRPAEAEEALRRALALSRSATLLSNLSQVCSVQGKAGDALALAREAVTLDPKAHRLHNSVGIALFRMRKYAEAEEAFSKALELEPTSAMVRFNRAWLYRETGDPTRCVRELEEIQRAAPAEDPYRKRAVNLLHKLRNE